MPGFAVSYPSKKALGSHWLALSGVQGCLHHTQTLSFSWFPCNIRDLDSLVVKQSSLFFWASQGAAFDRETYSKSINVDKNRQKNIASNHLETVNHHLVFYTILPDTMVDSVVVFRVTVAVRGGVSAMCIKR